MNKSKDKILRILVFLSLTFVIILKVDILFSNHTKGFNDLCRELVGKNKEILKVIPEAGFRSDIDKNP
jgi:hypothetical protein